MNSLSIIVSTYNAPRWLEKVIWGLQFQTYKNFQVVVADDGSTPDTADLIEKYRDVFSVPILHLWQEDHGFRKCRILNKAILAADGDYLIFTDGDCVGRRDFVEAHVQYAKPNHFLSGTYCKLPMKTSNEVDLQCVKGAEAFSMRWLSNHGYQARKHWSKFLARGMKLDGILNAISPSTVRFNGNNSSCWRDDAIAVGGFDERLGYGGEDHEFGYRLENAGIKPRQIRYAALCLHLHHEHGYVDLAKREENKMLIEQTRHNRMTFTEFGITRHVSPQAGEESPAAILEAAEEA